ncbi:MAG: AraC family transcriptional regulator [Bacteroidota bacterium]
MKQVRNGEFYGEHHQKLRFKTLVLTDTAYTHSQVDWHYHEHPYFTYLLAGQLYEAHRGATYYLQPGGLLYHHWQDAHHNRRPPIPTRGFHLELPADWFHQHGIQPQAFEGSHQIQHPAIRQRFNEIYREFRVNDADSAASIEMLLSDVFSHMAHRPAPRRPKAPWLQQLTDWLTEAPDTQTSLQDLSQRFRVHPVHLSRSFHQHLGMTLGQYRRLQKVNRAVLLLFTQLSLTEIGYRCGFYDQSHFIASFKRIYRQTPSQFRQQVSRR